MNHGDVVQTEDTRRRDDDRGVFRVKGLDGFVVEIDITNSQILTQW